MTYILHQRSQYIGFDCPNKINVMIIAQGHRLPGRFEDFEGWGKSVEVEQRSKKTEENKHGAVIAGCSAESETLFWEQKSKFESNRCLYNTDLQAP